MGFFSNNEHSNLYKSYEFPVVEGYSGTVGCGLALIEGYQNDLALFSAAVVSDLNEMTSLQEGASDSEVFALQEASVSGMIDAIKKFFIKLGAKIKALFTGFMAKLESYFVKDLKGYVKKYERSLDRKDFKDMKVKVQSNKINAYVVSDITEPSKYMPSDKINQTFNMTKEDMDTKYENTERDDLIKAWYNKMANDKVDTNSDFDEWYHEQMFNSEETKDDWDYAEVKKIATRMTDNTKCLSDTKKFYDKVQADIKKCLKSLDDNEKKIYKLYKGSTDGMADVGTGISASITRTSKTGSGQVDVRVTKDENDARNKQDLAVVSKAIQLVRQDVSAYQDVVLHISQIVMKEIKFAISQDKKVFAAAVAYKTVTGEATMLDMIAESAFDETMEDLDRIA